MLFQAAACVDWRRRKIGGIFCHCLQRRASRMATRLWKSGPDNCLLFLLCQGLGVAFGMIGFDNISKSTICAAALHPFPPGYMSRSAPPPSTPPAIHRSQIRSRWCRGVPYFIDTLCARYSSDYVSSAIDVFVAYLVMNAEGFFTLVSLSTLMILILGELVCTLLSSLGAALS